MDTHTGTISEPDISLFCNSGNETPQFTFAGLESWGRVVDVYDGDTLKIVMPYNQTMWKFNIRLYGIDTSEMTSKIQENKERAIRSRNRVIQLVSKMPAQLPSSITENKKSIQTYLQQNVFLVYVICKDMDKYGRILADVYSNNVSLSHTLLQEKLAYSYYGDTKQTEIQQAITGDS